MKAFKIILTTLSLSVFLNSCDDNYYGTYIEYPEGAYVGVASKTSCYNQQQNIRNIATVDYWQGVTGATASNSAGFSKRLITSTLNYSNYETEFGEDPVLVAPVSLIFYNLKVVDLRLANGWNNWREANIHGENMLSNYKTEEDVLVDFTSEYASYRTTYTIPASSCINPPAYLHLVLDNIDDFKSNSDLLRFSNTDIKAKKWVVEKILDLNGVDVTNDPDWDCYNDNVYTFAKNLSVKYETGDKTCEDVDDFLRDNGLQNVYQSFTITPERVDFDDPGKISLTFNAPPTDPELKDYEIEILSSDFESAVFRISKENGDQADLYLIPEEE